MPMPTPIPLPISNSATNYGSIAKSLHWLTVLLISAIIPLGVVAQDMSEAVLAGTATDGTIARTIVLFSLHKTLGVVLLFTAIARVIWTAVQPKPAHIHPERTAETFAADTVHWLLYGSLIIVPLSGWIHHASATGYAPIWGPFGQFLPFVPIDEHIFHLFGALHNISAKVLIGAIVFHVAGAAKHHFIDRDVTLRRIWFGPPVEFAHNTNTHAKRTPLIAALAVWGFAVTFGAGLGLFSSGSLVNTAKTPGADTLGGETLEQIESTWEMTDQTLALSIIQFGNAVEGKFEDWTANITFVPTRGPLGTKAGHVEIAIAIASLNLGSVTDQAKGFDFFDIEKYPLATFSADILTTMDEGYQAVGTLQIKDIALPLSLPFDLSIDNDTATMTLRLTLDRRNFGIGDNVPDSATLGFLVGLRISLTAVKRAKAP